MEKKLLIEGMSCNHCVNHVRTALTEDIKGVEVKEVSLDVCDFDYYLMELEDVARKYLVKKMNENHITIIMVSHDPLIASYSSRLLYLKDGKIEKELFKGDKTQQEYFKEIVSINSKEMQKMLD